MIEITIPSGRYTREELFDKLSKYFETDEDLEMFITAMQETNQLIELKEEEKTEEEKGKIIFATAEKKKVKRTTPLYLNIPPESEIAEEDRINQISVFRYTYYTERGEKKPRIAIRAGANWIKKHGTPQSVTLIKIFKDGKWIKIPEKPTFYPTKSPRYPKTIEAFRAEIPREIVRKYGITENTPLRVKMEMMVTGYLTTLKLWGYAITCMIFFGETKGKANPRNLELLGEDFVYETRRNIREMLKAKSDKTMSLLLKWLEKIDLEYRGVLERCIDDNTATIQKPLEGVQPTPLKEEEGRIAKMKFLDLDRAENRQIIAFYQSKYLLKDIPESLNVFEEVELEINKHLQEARKNSAMRKYMQTKLKNKEGF